MKKITLIACAALVAGLLVSCNNGAKDYNDVTTSATEYEYLVSGTIEVVADSTYKQVDKDNKQTDGRSSNITQTFTFESTPAFVRIATDEQDDTNYEGYQLAIPNGFTGYYERKANSATYWDYANSKEKDYTAAELKSNWEIEKTEDPIDLSRYDRLAMDNYWVYLYKIDGALKVAENGALFDATVDEDAIANGEDFTVTYTIVTGDTSNSETYTEYDADGKAVTTAGSSTNTVTSTSKTTKTYTLKFAAK